MHLKTAIKYSDMIRRFHTLSATALAAALVICLAPLDANAQTQDADTAWILASAKPRIVSQVGPYDDKRRAQIYNALNKEYLKLWDRGTGRIVATARSKTFRGFPYLKIEDRNRDGIGDFYAYYPKQSGGQTQEFGAFFDLANDGTPDWLVFYGGSLLGEGGAFNIVYWNHHAIDRNNDGKFDTLVLDCVDMNGNGKIEPGRTAWFYDANFDGKIDSGQHVEKGKATKMPVKGGRLVSGTPLKTFQKIRIGSDFGGLFNSIGQDIASLQ